MEVPSIKIPDRIHIPVQWDIKYGKGYFIYIQTHDINKRIEHLLNILDWIYKNSDKILSFNKNDDYKELYKINVYEKLLNKNRDMNTIDDLRYFVQNSIPIIHGTTEILDSYILENKIKIEHTYKDLCKEFISKFRFTGIMLEPNLPFLSFNTRDFVSSIHNE